MRRPSAGSGRWLTSVIVVLVLAGCGGDGDDGDDLARRQAEVARRGAEVMPFDLDATTHTFTPTADGGEQTVTADHPGDVEQVELIRGHLLEERDAFSRGDFGDPAAIHGHDMPGVAELEAGFRDVAVDYEELSDGARLTYRADRPELVDAIHAWFERQVMDHGAHAEGG